MSFRFLCVHCGSCPSGFESSLELWESFGGELSLVVNRLPRSIGGVVLASQLLLAAVTPNGWRLLLFFVIGRVGVFELSIRVALLYCATSGSVWPFTAV